MRRSRLMMLGLAVAGVTLGFGAAPSVAAQDYAQTPEHMVLRAFNVCWDAERGGDLRRLARAEGMAENVGTEMPSFFRDVGGSVIFLAANARAPGGGPHDQGCRVTAIRPQVDTTFLRRGPVLSDPTALIEGMTQAAQRFDPPYRVVVYRQPHPTRAGHRRTILRADEGARGRVIYLEEGPRDYEFFYFHGDRATVSDPALLDGATIPEGRAYAQAFVDDRWVAAFCELNPHACSDPGTQQASQDDWSPGNWVLPFSGIGGSGGDNRTASQRSRDESWWRNYHATGRGGFD